MLQVRIREITIKSPGHNKLLLNNASLDLIENKVFTILGKNGSGKSTFAKSITGLLDKRHYSVWGTVHFRGKDIFALNPVELLQLRRDSIKYVFQDSVNSFNQLKKLDYYFELLSKDKSEIDELLSYFLLPDSKKLYKMHPYEVSGGMAQRISFVLALLSKPEIIILDEPTSGIDSAIANLFLLKLREFASQNRNSVLLITQDISFAEKASDKIAYLSTNRLSTFYEVKDFFRKKDDPLLVDFLEANKHIEE
jgi:ABC-type glutathione transport system ATPase component